MGRLRRGDGCALQYGRLFRSAEPGPPGEAAQQALDALTIRTVYDLRSTGERGAPHLHRGGEHRTSAGAYCRQIGEVVCSEAEALAPIDRLTARP